MYQTIYSNGEFVPFKIELNLTEYKITGFALIKDIDDNEKTVTMSSFSFPAEGIVNEYEFKNIIQSLINDNGYHCKELRGAKVYIHAVYENKNLIDEKKEFYIRDEIISKSDIKPLTGEEINLIRSESCWFVSH